MVSDSLCVYSFVTGDKVLSIKKDDFPVGPELNRKFLSHYFVKSKASAMNEHPYGKTKKLGEISTTTKKPYKQKGTGNARRGTMCAAHHRGGAKAFGPTGVKASIKVNKKETLLAKRILIAEYVRNDLIVCVDNFSIQTQKTKSAIESLSKILGVDFKSDKSKKVLLIHDSQIEEGFLKSVRNLFFVKVVSVSKMTPLDLVGKFKIVCSKDAFSRLLSL